MVDSCKGLMELIVDKVKYHVRLAEQESFRSIENSFFHVPSEVALGKKTVQEEDDGKDPSNDEVVKNSDMEAYTRAQDDEMDKQSDVEENKEETNPTN